MLFAEMLSSGKCWFSGITTGEDYYPTKGDTYWVREMHEDDIHWNWQLWVVSDDVGNMEFVRDANFQEAFNLESLDKDMRAKYG